MASLVLPLSSFPFLFCRFTDPKSCDKRLCHRCGLFTPLHPGMWWCLVAAKYWLTAWGEGVQEYLSHSSQEQHSKPQSKSTHLLWFYPGEISDPAQLGSLWLCLKPPTRFWVQTLLSAHFCDPWNIYITNLLATEIASHWSSVQKMSWHESSGHAEHFILLTSGECEWWLLSRLTTQGEVTA